MREMMIDFIIYIDFFVLSFDIKENFCDKMEGMRGGHQEYFRG